MADSAIEEIKRRIDLVDLISETVSLKRAGKSFKGLCPFHSEKTPSFTVSPERGTWHCFGCGEGGDAFSFVQRRDNLDFGEALRFLAPRAGVELEEIARPDPAVRQRRDRLRELLSSAALFYRAALGSPSGTAARAYVDRRGLTAETVERFGLGYAEPTGRALERHLVRAGFTSEEAVAAGALGQADDGRTYDRFRNRLIFPIRDAEGLVIGFGGRALEDGQQPKYLNSPQTDLFDKGGSLYALDQAGTTIRQSRQAVVVEGYMDVLTAHQRGFTNVVATLGTALTERHLHVLRRLASEVILCLDSDDAGIKAAVRGSEVANESTVDESPRIPIPRISGLGPFFVERRTQLKAMTLPDGRDPDDVIRESPELWEQRVREALPLVDFVLSVLDRRHDLRTNIGQREAAREAMSVIQELPNPVERAHYIQRLARLLNTREEFLLQAAETRPRRHAAAPAPPPEPPRSYDQQLEEYVLALLLRAPADATRPDPSDLESAVHRAMLQRLVELAGWRDPGAALESLARDLGAPFVEPIERLRIADSENERLTPDEVAKELRVRTLELRKLRLFRQHQALDSVLREEASQLSADEQREYRHRLAELAAHLGRVFAEQRQLGAVGSTSWSIRRGQEVLGG